MSTATETLLTAEQYRLLPENGQRTELVRGRVVEMNVPAPRHGALCSNVVWELSSFVRPRELGRVLPNDSGVLTERGPDTVRGPDVCYYSYNRLPKGPIPAGYLDVVPELVFEVRSRTDRWDQILTKVGEFLRAGITAVCVVDEKYEAIIVYRLDELQQIFTADDEFALPDIFGQEFRVSVSRFFAD
jgi:Uma2 family endonuclease